MIDLYNIFSNLSISSTLIYGTFITIGIYYLLDVSNLKRKFLGTPPSQFPPGPWGIPVLGNLLQITKDPHLKLAKWSKKYGKLYTIYLGPRPAVVVNDSQWVKELLGTNAATRKFKSDTILLLSQGQYGILNSEGKAWMELRTFCIKSMKQLGLLGSGFSMESSILTAIDEVCDWINNSLKKNNDKSLFLATVLKEATVNTLWTLVTGERIEIGDSLVGRIMHEIEVAVQYSVKTGLGFFPSLKYLAPGLSGYNALDKATKDAHQFIEEEFENHKRTYMEGVRRDMIDMYIEHFNEIQRKDDRNSCFYGKIGWMNCVTSVVEIFLAGGETTAFVTNWALVHLAYNQKVQGKIQKEIDEIVGKDRKPSFFDRERMPYTEAVILETLRISSVLPLGVIHELNEDLNFHDYLLPKGILLVPNMYFIHHNPDVWGDPEVFRPERFLVEEEENLKECLITFQPGRRQCLGEPIAKDILFIFVTRLMQDFNVELDPSVPREEYLKPDVGLLMIPKAFGLVMSQRKN